LSYFENGDFDAAVNSYNQAIKQSESSVHLNNRGLAYYHIGNA
jgi:lipoprotein NlpI